MANDPVRYLVEHVALRDALFSAGPGVILDFMDNPGPAMIELYKELGEETPGYECPYTEECFSEDHEVFDKGNDSVLIIRVFMPEPEETLNCRAVYFCFSRLSGSNFYATSELTEKRRSSCAAGARITPTLTSAMLR